MIRTYIAGNKHRTVNDQLAFRTLTSGTQLTLVPEPDNKFDNNAVQVHDGAGHFLGYVPASRCIEVLDLLGDNPDKVVASWQNGALEITTQDEVDPDGEQD